jgi:hypothetical protein
VQARDLALLSSEISTLRSYFCDRSHSIEEEKDVDSEGVVVEDVVDDLVGDAVDVVEIIARQGVVLATANLVRQPNGNCE